MNADLMNAEILLRMNFEFDQCDRQSTLTPFTAFGLKPNKTPASKHLINWLCINFHMIPADTNIGQRLILDKVQN